MNTQLHDTAIFFPLGYERIESGSYTSRVMWKRGLDEYNRAEKLGCKMAIIFGDASDYSSNPYRWAVIDRLEPHKSGVIVRFSGIRRIPRGVSTRMTKLSDGVELSPHVRRGYSVVHRPEFLPEQIKTATKSAVVHSRNSLNSPPLSMTDERAETLRAQGESLAELFDPASEADGRQRVLRDLVLRQGQSAFRQRLLVAYNRRCAVTACHVVQVLEAAHIVPYKGTHTNPVTNGLLLRSDIHVLFDLDLLRIDPMSLTVILAQSLLETPYRKFHGRALRLPSLASEHPSRSRLRRRIELYEFGAIS